MAQFSQIFLQADIPFHLGNGQFRTFSKDELRDYVENSRRMMFDGGLGIHVKSEHPPPGTPEGGPTPFDDLAKQFSGPKAEQFADAIKTAGWVKDLHFDEATGKASVLFEVKSKPYIQAIREDRIRFSSPELREQYQDGLGREWGPTFAHFALTPKPRNPLQTVIKEVSSGQQQYAMQFSMADAVGIEPQDVPTLQFYDAGASKELSSRKRRMSGAARMAQRQYNTNSGLAEEKGPDARERLIKGVGASPQVKPVGQIRGTSAGIPGGASPVSMPDKQYKRKHGKHKPPAGKYGLPGSQFTPGYGRKLSSGPYFQGSEEMVSQFDTNMMDMAPGYPPVPPIPAGPQSFDPSGLGTATNMLNGLPVENPDVIQLPDDAKRQKSEAAVQLLDQIGISLAVGTDLTKLDDSALDSLLAALKTKIKANQEAEEAEVASMQDQQLKEQVPMIGQMSEDEADAIIGRSLVEIAQMPTQFGANYGSLRQKKDNRQESGRARQEALAQRMGKLDEESMESIRRGRQSERDDMKFRKKPRQVAQGRSLARRRTINMPQTLEKAGIAAMSEGALTKRLANFKKRHDSQARQGLRKLIATSKLPPGMKAKLAGDVSGVQFSEAGPELPTYTVQDVIELFNGSCPDGMQFGDRALVDALEEPTHPKQDRWTRRGAESNGMNADAAQFAADGVTMSREDLERYYADKAKQPDWASRLMPTANGNGRTH